MVPIGGRQESSNAKRKLVFEQCLKCRHLITKKNMNTGKKTYACDNGVAQVNNYGSFNYVDENDVVIPSSKGAECSIIKT